MIKNAFYFKLKTLLALKLLFALFLHTQQQAYTSRTTTESLKPCIQLVIFYCYLFRNFSSLFFFRTSRSEGEFPKGYLTNIVTRQFAYITIAIK